MKTTKEIRTARNDLFKKTKELLVEIHKRNMEILKKVLAENPDIVQEYIEAGENYTVPKDLVVAFMNESAWGYSAAFCTTGVKRKSAKRIKKYQRLVWSTHGNIRS